MPKRAINSSTHTKKPRNAVYESLGDAFSKRLDSFRCRPLERALTPSVAERIHRKSAADNFPFNLLDEAPMHTEPYEDASLPARFHDLHEDDHNPYFFPEETNHATDEDSVLSDDVNIVVDDFGYDIWEDALALSEGLHDKAAEVKPVYRGCMFTNKDLASDLTLFFHENVSNATGERSLLALLAKYFPDDNGFSIPYRVNRKGFVESDLDRFKCLATDGIYFDICRSGGCTVFAGRNNDLRHCPVCNTPRYTNCTHADCKKQSTFDESKCTHRDDKRFRASMKFMTYKPLHTVFSQLLSTKGFLSALNYKPAHIGDGMLRDIPDSPHCVQHLKEMQERFLSLKSNGHIDEGFEEVSILLSEFYDGAQIYRWKASAFYPFVVGILNLPPTYRSKLGVGMFLNTLFTSKAGSAAEDFIFQACFVGELLKFYDGVEMCVNGKKYFVQARLVLHIADTIGLQNILRVTGANSSSGCALCYTGSGVYRVDLHKVIYLIRALHLPHEHWLRTISNLPCCCPLTYFRKSDKEMTEKEEFFGDGDRSHSCGSELLSYYELLCSGKKKYESNLNENWFHKKFPFKEYFLGKLNYHYRDYRDPVAWQRRPNAFYLTNGAIALETQKASNGVKGVWHFNSLPYVNISTDISYDPMHVLKNWGDAFLDLLLGNRCKAKQDLQEYLQKCGSTWDVKDLPWVLTKDDKERIDCMLECICIPSGFAKDFDVRRICHEKFAIKSSGYITMITALMPLIMKGATSLPKQYKAFFLMAADDFTDLLAVEIDPSKMDELFNRIYELLALKEGLFPDSEAQLIFHQILHLRTSLEKFGPLRNSWAMAGERSIRRIKEYCSRAYEQNSLSKYSSFETMQMQQAYDFDIDGPLVKDKYQANTNDINRVYVVDQKMEFNDRLMSIDLHEGTYELSDLESNSLVASITLEVLKVYEDEILASQNNLLYRLYKFYCDKIYGNSFISFLRTLQEILIGNRSDEFDGRVNCLQDVDVNMLADVIDSLTSLPVFRKAVVHGIKMKSRGFEYCEKGEAETLPRNYGALQSYSVFLPVSECNNLANNWNDIKGRNSWGKIRIHTNNNTNRKNGGSGQLESSIRYVQNNFFFFIDMKLFGDNHIGRMLFASTTARYVKNCTVYCKEVLQENNRQIPLYDPKILFVPLENFFSTAVAFCAFGTSGNEPRSKPIYWKNYKDKFCDGKEKHFCDSEEQVADSLFMIDVHPERRCI